uniref:Uncharacterized protein n=1 Tax=Triticum urartu TaxID=4572 RepID=A0A8R7P154_TRIUA
MKISFSTLLYQPEDVLYPKTIGQVGEDIIIKRAHSPMLGKRTGIGMGCPNFFAVGPWKSEFFLFF